MLPADFGDRVRIARTRLTEESGHAGRAGTCYGFTTPSVTGVEVIGDTAEDLALAVSFEVSDTVWFAPDLIELVDHGAGTVAQVGTKTYVRTEDGQWVEPPPEGR